MKKSLSLLKILTLLLSSALIFPSCEQSKWITLFDGSTLNGWKPSENLDSWKVEDGALVTRGERSHLFYIGDGDNQTFKNFILSADVKTTPNSNSGIHFHTEFQDEGWLDAGYEMQVMNSSVEQEAGKYVERKLTGSIYGIRNLAKSPANDNEWFTVRLEVMGKTIRTYINDELIADYTEPENLIRANKNPKNRRLSSGNIALQCHDPNSTVYYKNIKLKPLPDDLSSPGTPSDDPEFEEQLIQHVSRFPLVDYHIHLKGGLTTEELLDHSRKYGITYGIAFNCGLKMGFESDDSLRNFLATYQKPPQTFLAMQAEGREWLDLFSEETIGMFDYVFTDAMTWTNKNGKRMRLWIKEETEVGDPEDFMEQLVENIELILDNEPIDIYVNASYLPDEISGRYDELWTDDRMDRVIAALKRNEIALEISARYRIPSEKFISRAKDAGVKFTFGTNNAGADDLGRLEYCIEMTEKCKLALRDFWFPSN
jgi:hypothetical protein